MKKRILRINCKLFMELFNGQDKSFKTTKETKLPEDTDILDVRFNGFDICFDLLITSNSFEENKNGEPIPEHIITLESLTPSQE